MLINSVSKAVFAGNGITTHFPFVFKVWTEAQLLVQVTTPQGETHQVTDFTATLAENGGTVTYMYEGAPLAEGYTLVILRQMPFAQEVDLINGTRFDSEVIEDALDKATAERQELRERVERAIVMPASSGVSPDEFVETLFSSAVNSAASAAAAAESAAQAAQSESLAGESKDVALVSAQSAAADAEKASQYVIQAGLDAPKIVQMVTDEGVKQVDLVNEAGEIEIQEIRNAGTEQVTFIDTLTEGIETEGTRQVSLIQDALYTVAFPSVAPNYSSESYAITSPVSTEITINVSEDSYVFMTVLTGYLGYIGVTSSGSSRSVILYQATSNITNRATFTIPARKGDRINVRAHSGNITIQHFIVTWGSYTATGEEAASLAYVTALSNDTMERLASKQPIGNYALADDIPMTLPNPYALTINGTAYDGSSPVEMTIQGGGSGGGISEAPFDAKQYARQNGAWSQVENVDVPMASATTAGKLYMHFDEVSKTLYLGTKPIIGA